MQREPNRSFGMSVTCDCVLVVESTWGSQMCMSSILNKIKWTQEKEEVIFVKKAAVIGDRMTTSDAADPLSCRGKEEQDSNRKKIKYF